VQGSVRNFIYTILDIVKGIMSAQTIFERMKESLWPGKRKVVGLPVYLEENGEVLGVVSDIVESKDGKIISYVLENEVSTFNIPVENLLVTKRGLIYTPAWYAEADRFIKTLEIQEALMPDVFVLLAEENVSKEQVKKIMDKASPATKQIVQDGLQLLESTTKKLETLRKESSKIYSMISEMTEKRVLGVVDRKEFAKNIFELKRKAQILEASMKKASEILTRLESSALLRVARQLSSEESQKQEKEAEMRGTAAGAPQITPEQRAKIKKFRVLKVEKELREMEQKLKASEEEIAKRVNAEVEKKLAERENLLRSQFVSALDSIERELSKLSSAKIPKDYKGNLERAIKEVQKARDTVLKERKTVEGEGAVTETIVPEGNVCPLCGAVFEKGLDTCPVCGYKIVQAEKKEKQLPAPEKKVVKKVEKK